MDRDSRPIRELDQFCALKKQRPPGIHRQSGRARTPHLFDGGQANHGYIKSHILPRLANFHDHEPLAARDSRGACNGFIGAFHRFHRHARALRDHHGLPNVHSCDVSGHSETIRDVFRFVLVRPAPREHTWFRVQWLEEQRRIHKADALFFQHSGHGANERVRISARQGKQ